MIKEQEIETPNSCLNKARNDERIFVLLERDHAAPTAIRAWVRKRIELGKNRPDDEQIQEALHCAAAMEAKHK